MKKRLFFLFILIAGLQLEANALRIKQNHVIYEFDLESNTAELIELEKNFEGDLIIPERIDMTYIEGPVVRVAENAFREHAGLRDITLPESLTSIGEYNQEIKGKTNVEIIPVSA